MIRLLILETDRMVCQMLKGIVESMKDFQLVGTVDSIEELSAYKADLIIGEIQGWHHSLYERLLEQRIKDQCMDIIPITGVVDYAVYKRYAGIGAIDFILKPFEASRVKQALMRYQKWKLQLIPDEDVRQERLDAFYYPGIIQEETRISVHTYKRIGKYIHDNKKGWFTAREAAMEMKISPVTMRRYLERMYKSGDLMIQLQYGKKGRPVYEYCIRKKEADTNGYYDRSNAE